MTVHKKQATKKPVKRNKIDDKIASGRPAKKRPSTAKPKKAFS